MPQTFDLQSHSIHSDGALPAAEVVALAAAAGIELLALSDHDTVDGVGEALEEARRRGIAVSPAAEISAVDGEFEDLHVVGYEIDHTDATLLATLEDWRADRERRVERMADRVEELGLALDRGELERRKAAGKPLGRPHLAQGLLSHPDNKTKLAELGIEGPDQLFPAYLVPGAPAYVARDRPTVAEAIEVIHAAGGVAVWAHPFWDLDDPEQTVASVERYAQNGLDGVERFYPTHSEAQTRLLHETCERLGLLITGSTDFHGPEHKRFSGFGAFETYELGPNLGPIGTKPE